MKTNRIRFTLPDGRIAIDETIAAAKHVAAKAGISQTVARLRLSLYAMDPAKLYAPVDRIRQANARQRVY